MNPEEQDAESDAAANLLEAAFFGLSLDEGVDQASVDLSSDLPLIEGYKLLRLLGEGGFGMVYEAEQRVPIRRRVALKVLRPGCTTRELLVRFEQERQALALMNHPHIARIYDAGETEDGRPFIAMEMVDGSTIDKRTKSLSLGEKVTLMLEVCRAVAHAHHKGIIHRDLKPSNILITNNESGKLEPRVIDFGIAKALDGPLVTKVMFTQIRQVVGTPGYMSPERQHTSQISHSADTRTDVFALGAILWELLSGRKPVQSPDGGSTRVTLPNVHGIPDELRWITEKATDPDMERRYANADGLADDLEAWLEGMPLKAAPRSTLYVVSKWAARHRAASVVSLLLIATLIASLILLTQKNQQIGQALRQAEANNAETLRRSANESYLMGVTRERRRPVLGLAHWAHALRQDPQNQAAIGIALSTLNHRRYPYVLAPATRIPVGKVVHVALSANAQWAAVILKIQDGEVLLRAQRGATEATVHPIPADGRMTLLAVSNAGHVAVAAPRGPVGLLQADGTWKASVRDMEGLRFIAWTPNHQLWWVGVNAVARIDVNGKDAGKLSTLTGREWRSVANESGNKLAVGIEAGRILLFDAGDQEPREIKAPIPAPFSALAVDATGERVAAAWRNGELWMHNSNGTTSTYRAGESVMHLTFMPDDASLLMQRPEAIGLWNVTTGGPGRSLPMTEPLKTLLPAGPSSVLMQTTLGKPAIQDLRGKGNAEELPGIEGRVHCTTSAGGSVLLVVDEDHQVIEWLATPAAPLELSPATAPQTWLTLVPFSEPGHWVGIDTSGDVCKVTPDGKSTSLWQTGNESLRLASIDKTGTTALVDVQGSPGVFVSRRDERLKLMPWGKPSAMVLSPDARFAALGYPAGEVRIFDLASGRTLVERDWHRGAISAVTFIGSNRLAVAASSQVRVWDWQQDRVLPTPIDLSGTIRALAPCSAGARLAATGDDATLHVIDVESGRRIVGALPAPENCTALAWAADDTHLHAYSSDSTVITIPMPPLLRESPPWLPSWMEHHIGMKIDDQGRAERLRASVQMRVPSNAEANLKIWLLK